MKTQVKLRDGIKIPQPMTEHEWTYGYIDGYCRAADDRCYAIVVTQHGEFEYVQIQYLIQCDWQ